MGKIETKGTLHEAPLPFFTVDEDTPLQVFGPDGLLANDSDPVEGSPVYVQYVADYPTHGSLYWSSDGSFTLKAGPAYGGMWCFSRR